MSSSTLDRQSPHRAKASITQASKRRLPTARSSILPPLIVALLGGAPLAFAADEEPPPGHDDLRSPREQSQDKLLKDAAAQSVALGESQDSDDVTPSGAYTRQIPLNIPRGLGGLAPKIAVSYSSNLGNGLLGVGWSLTGFPAITRGKTRSFQPSVGRTDGYYFVAGGWGTPESPSGHLLPDPVVSSRFQTVEYSPSRIFEPSGTCGDGPCSWSMRDGRGNTYYFGVTNRRLRDPDGLDGVAADPWFLERPTPVGGGQRGRIAWLLSRVIDVYGNEYRIHYQNLQDPGGAPYPVSIEYSLHDGAPYGLAREVKLAWEARPDRLPVPTLYGMRLKTVTVFAGNAALDSYSFVYEQSPTSGRSRLTGLQKLGSDGVTGLPPYVFHYQDGPAPGPIDPSSFSSPRGARLYWQRNDRLAGGTFDSDWKERWPLMFGDVNGDGRSDAVIAYNGTGGTLIEWTPARPSGLFEDSLFAISPTGFNAIEYETKRAIFRLGTVLNIDGSVTPQPNADWCEDIPLMGDVNADGFDDVTFVSINMKGIYTETSYGSPTGLTALQQSKYFIDGTALNTTGGCYHNAIERPRWRATLADINGDHALDLILIHPNPEDPLAIQALGTPEGLGGFERVGSGPVTKLGLQDVRPMGTSGGAFNDRFLSGDINGDGIADVLYLNAVSYGSVIYWLGNFGSGLTSAEQLNGLFATCDLVGEAPGGRHCAASPFAGDFNGDGRLDVSIGRTTVYGDAAPGAELQVLQVPGKDPRVDPTAVFYSADVNGDGLSDSNVNLSWLNGLADTPPGQTGSLLNPRCTTGLNWNADDKADCLAFSYRDTGLDLDLRLGTASGLANPAVLASFPGYRRPTELGDHVDAYGADLNADGLSDLVIETANDGLAGRQLGVHLTEGVLPDLLIRVDNGLGGVTEIQYGPVSSIHGAVDVSSNSPFGRQANSTPRWVVTSLRKSNGLALAESRSFNYLNGFVTPGLTNYDDDDGFEWVQVTDDKTHEHTSTRYTWAGGAPRRPAEIRKYFSTGAIRSLETFKYEYAPANWLAGFQGDFGPTHRTLVEYEQAAPIRQIDTDYQYASYGDVKYERVCTAEPGGASPYCIVTTRSFTDDLDNWRLGRLDWERRQVENGVIMDWERRTYAPQPYLLEKRERLLCDNAETCVCTPDQGCFAPLPRAGASPSRWVPVEQTRMHDPAGNLLFVRDALYHGTLYQIDYASGAVEPTLVQRTVTSDGKSVDLAIRKTYYADGQLSSETDENGHLTRYYYDVLGRPTRTEHPDGTAETLIYADIGKLDAANPAHSQRVIVANSPNVAGWPWPSASNLFGEWVEQLFDGRGVVYKRRVRANDGKVAESERDERYGSTGLMVQYSKPHFTGPAPEWIQVLYVDGRPSTIQRVNASGVLIAPLRSYSYFTDHVEVQEPQGGTPVGAAAALGGITSTYRDTRGLVRQLVDPLGGTTYYTNSAAERVRTVNQPNGDSYSVIYDNWGRERWIQDTWTGTTTLQYDDVDNLLNRTDARPRTVTHAYDEANRIVSTTTGDGTTTFHYDSCQNGVGHLCRVDAPDHDEELGYDVRGRVQTRAIIDGETKRRLETTYGYDLYGHLSTKVMPDGTTLGYPHSDAGNLEGIDVSGTRIATFGDYTALGKIGFRSDLSGTISSYAYNAEGLLATVDVRDRSFNALIAARYTYDYLGNVLTIEDLRAQKPVDEAQSFGYDQLSRLTSATGPYGTLAYTYDGNGIPTKIGAATVERTDKRLRGYTWVSRLLSLNPLKISRVQVDQFVIDHDVAGYVTSSTDPQGASTLEYDDEGRLKRISRQGAPLLELAYDTTGQRYKKVYHSSTGALITTLYLDGYELRLNGRLEAITKHIGAPDVGVIASMTSGHVASVPALSTLPSLIGQSLGGTTVNGLVEGTQYYYANHIGSTAVVTDATGQQIARNAYEPYGRVAAAASRGSRTTNLNFTGQELDEESGLLYYNARYYLPTVGRFLSPDSEVPGGVYKSGSLNRYAYVFNNPVRYEDPTGHGDDDSKNGSYWSIVDRAIDNLRNPPPSPAAEDLRQRYLSLPGPVRNAVGSAFSVLESLTLVATVGNQQQRTIVDELRADSVLNEESKLALASSVRRMAGGIGPVAKGLGGVNAVAAFLQSVGGVVLGKEITIDVGAVRIRIDLYAKLPNGQRVFIEVKTGPSARWTKNQAKGLPDLATKGGVPRGNNADKAGLPPGQQIGATPTWTVHN